METPIQQGFRVIRGPDWTYKNQDGGKGYAGTVLRLHDERRPHFPKLSVLVQWDNGDKGLYRAGYDQAFDLRIIDTAHSVRHPKVWCDGCDVDEIRGIRWRCTECYAIDLCTTCYMNDEHDLSHIFMRVLSSDKTSMGPKMLPRSSSSRLALRGRRGGYVYNGHLPNLGDLEPVNEGDKVLVTATPAELEELHQRRGLWQPEMANTFREKGFVNRRTNTGDFTVYFHDSEKTFNMNSAALRKIHPLCLGQLVRISDDIEMVKRLQSRHGGSTAAMKKAIGTVGKVVEIDGLDIRVRTKDNQKFIFNSANLTPERIRAPNPEDVTIEEQLSAVKRMMQDPESSIMSAAETGDIKAVERILAIHPESIIYEPMPNSTVIGSSAVKGNLQMMKFLVKKGAFIENNHYSPLLHATVNNKYEAVKYLLDQGADVHTVNPLGYTCLSKACEEGFFQCAHYQLMHGADVNHKDDNDLTPVHLSIASGGRTIVDLIMERKEADLKAVTRDLTSPMHCVAAEDNTYAMTKLLDKIPRLVEAKDYNGQTPLYLAAVKGRRDAVKLLIKRGHCNVNIVESEFGFSPLAAAIFSENFHVVDVLVKHGADVNLPNHIGNTSLYTALKVYATRRQKMKEEPYMAEMKMKWGHIGIKTNSDALLAFLVSHGGDLNAYNFERVTIKDLLQLNREPILQPLLKIQSQRGVTTEAEKKNLPEMAQSDRTDSVKPLNHALDDRSATGKFGALGGKLSTKSHGFTFHIPPGALEKDEKISLRVLTEIPNGLTLQEDELLVSHGFQCYPSGLHFKTPAKLIIPHCALVTAPNKVQAILYSWNGSGTPKRLPDSSNIICSVQERCLEVSVSHFSGGFISLIRDRFFLKGILLSCMSFLPRVLPLSKKPVLEVRFVKKPHDQRWNDVHALNDSSVKPVKGDDDEIMFRKRTPLTVACQLGEKSPKSDVHAIQHKDIRQKNKVTEYFTLDLTEESDETLVTLEVVQTTTQTIKFNTSFQGINERCTEKDSPSPSNFGIPTGESREQGFDNFLKTIARRIHKDDEIDSLGGVLGFEPSEIQRYIQMNERNQHVTYMGTLKMLRDWRNKTSRSEECEQLKKALISINHRRLAEDLMYVDMARN